VVICLSSDRKILNGRKRARVSWRTRFMPEQGRA
jgi:hypothetical protein